MKYPIYSSKTVYPEDIQCVLEPKNGKGGIYVGNLEASESLETLKKHGIKAVLTAAKDIFLRHPKNDVPDHLHIPGEDHERFDLSKYFDISIAFIKKSLEKTNILVHCMAGISRSVTLVLAYLMKHHEFSYAEAFEAVRRKRKIINPNKGFIRQLQEFERTLESELQKKRRSCDGHETKEKIRLDSSRKSFINETKVQHSLNESLRRPFDSRENNLKYLTAGLKSEDLSYHRHGSKYTVPKASKTNVYGTYGDLNKELDEKIANIRKKYLEATNLISREDRNQSAYAPKHYLNQSTSLFKVNNYMEPTDLKKTMSTMAEMRNTRTHSFTGYLNQNLRRTDSKYYY